MSITVVLPHALLPYASGLREVVVDGRCASVREAFDALAVSHPAVYDRVLTELGEVRPHVNVFVGDESIRFLDGLGTPLTDGDAILIVPAVSGG